MARREYTRISSFSLEGYRCGISIVIFEDSTQGFIANEPDQTDMDEDDEDAWTGNLNRRLWKSACTRAALNVCYHFFILVGRLPEHNTDFFSGL